MTNARLSLFFALFVSLALLSRVSAAQGDASSLTPVLLCVSSQDDRWFAHFTYTLEGDAALEIRAGAPRNLIAVDGRYFTGGLALQPSSFSPRSQSDPLNLEAFFTVEVGRGQSVTWYLGEQEVSIGREDFGWNALQCPSTMVASIKFALKPCFDKILLRSILLANVNNLIFFKSAQNTLSRTDLLQIEGNLTCANNSNADSVPVTAYISFSEAPTIAVPDQWPASDYSSYQLVSVLYPYHGNIVPSLIENIPKTAALPEPTGMFLNISSLEVRVGKPGAGPKLPPTNPPSTKRDDSLPLWQRISSDAIVICGAAAFLVIISVVGAVTLAKWLKARKGSRYTPIPMSDPADAVLSES